MSTSPLLPTQLVNYRKLLTQDLKEAQWKQILGERASFREGGGIGWRPEDEGKVGLGRGGFQQARMGKKTLPGETEALLPPGRLLTHSDSHYLSPTVPSSGLPWVTAVLTTHPRDLKTLGHPSTDPVTWCATGPCPGARPWHRVRPWTNTWRNEQTLQPVQVCNQCAHLRPHNWSHDEINLNVHQNVHLAIYGCHLITILRNFKSVIKEKNHLLTPPKLTSMSKSAPLRFRTDPGQQDMWATLRNSDSKGLQLLP